MHSWDGSCEFEGTQSARLLAVFSGKMCRRILHLKLRRSRDMKFSLLAPLPQEKLVRTPNSASESPLKCASSMSNVLDAMALCPGYPAAMESALPMSIGL